jgi:uncharacterized RDD family membrane protein YckC
LSYIVSVQTSQNVALDYPAASIGDRIVARLVDYGIFIGYFIGLTVVAPKLFENSPLIALAISLPVILYSLICEYFLNGQTLGKKVMNIKVIRLDGTQPTLGNYVIRWLFRLIDNDLMGGLIGLSVILASQKGQRIGDMLAGTTVIKMKKAVLLEDALLQAEEKEKEYAPAFPQVTKLSDKQIGLIREVIATFKKEGSYELITSLSDKLKRLLDIQSNMPAYEFLNTLLRDYAYLNGEI